MITHPRSLDRALSVYIGKIPQSVKPLMLFATFMGTPLVIFAIVGAIIVLAIITDNRQLLVSSIGLLILSPLAEGLKLLTRRKRPETLYVEQMRFKTYSFPSGHSYTTALVFGYIAGAIYALSTLGMIAACLMGVLIILVGVSRVFLGAHFPSDVIAGWILSGLVLLALSAVGRY